MCLCPPGRHSSCTDAASPHCSPTHTAHPPQDTPPGASSHGEHLRSQDASLQAASPWYPASGKGNTAFGQGQTPSKPEYRSVPAQEGRGKGSPWPAKGGGILSSLPLWLPLAGNQVLEEYLWDWHLEVVLLGSSRSLRDQKEDGEAFLNPPSGPSPVAGPGDSSPLTVPSNPAGVSQRATRGPRMTHGTSTHGKDGRFWHN